MKKDLKVCYECYELFEKRAFAEVISSSNYYVFLRLNSSVRAIFKFSKIPNSNSAIFEREKLWRAPKCFVVNFRIIEGI